MSNCPAGSPPPAASRALKTCPDRARAYLAFLENQTGVEIGGVSTGPERNQTIIRSGSKLERLIG